MTNDYSGFGPRATDVSATNLSDGSLQVFVVDNTADSHAAAVGMKITWTRSADPGDTWSEGEDFQRLPGGQNTRTVLAVTIPGGFPQLFSCYDIGIATCWKVSADRNADWTPWQPFGLPVEATGVRRLVAAQDAGSLTHLFCLDVAGDLWTCAKETAEPGAPWSSWERLTQQVTVAGGSPGSPPGPTLPVVEGPPVLREPPVLIQGPPATAGLTLQVAIPRGDWADISAWRRPEGTLEVLLVTAQGQVHTLRQLSAVGAVSPHWGTLSDPWDQQGVVSVAACRLAAGGLQVFAVQKAGGMLSRNVSRDAAGNDTSSAWQPVALPAGATATRVTESYLSDGSPVMWAVTSHGLLTSRVTSNGGAAATTSWTPWLGFRVANRYVFSIDSLEVLTRRSGGLFMSSDTDWLSMSVSVGGRPAVSLSHPMGDLSGGTYPLGLPIEVEIGPGEAAMMTYIVVNKGKNPGTVEKDLVKASNALAEAGATAATAAISSTAIFAAVTEAAVAAATAAAGASIGAVVGETALPVLGAIIGLAAGWLVGEITGLVTANCDGPVAAGAHLFFKDQLQSSLEIEGAPVSGNDDNPGIDSAHGCGGDNSHYRVQWSVTQPANDYHGLRPAAALGL